MKTQLALVNSINAENFIKPLGTTSQNKPKIGGFWTSTLTEDGKSDWMRFALAEEIYSDERLSELNSYEIEISESARILTIDSKEDYEIALSKYGTSVLSDVELVLQSFYSKSLGSFLLDYEKMAQDYDALNLTHSGRSSNTAFFGWDCESTVWLNLDCFEKITKVENKF